MTLAHCASCDLWLGPNDACLHIAANPVGQHAERDGITKPIGFAFDGNPGASTLPGLAGQLARGDSFCPLGAVTPRIFVPSHASVINNG